VSVYADTSAFYALLVGTDEFHEPVRASFSALLRDGRLLWTTSFVIVETMALLQARVGLAAARDFDEEVLPVVNLHWVDEALYRRGTERLWREDRRDLSLVDCVSFEFMKTHGIGTALAVDPHFVEAGFAVVPAIGRKRRR
jgi:predicted nucleic acid-binding protein